MANTTTVYVVIIEHKSWAKTLSVHDTDIDANEHLLDYCKEHWSQEYATKDLALPDEPGDIISWYFEKTGESGGVEEADSYLGQS